MPAAPSSRDAAAGGSSNDLPRRAYLTAKHHGWRELLVRLVDLPLRLVGLERGLRARMSAWATAPRQRGWYRREGRPVTIVMPTYGDPVHHDRRRRTPAPNAAAGRGADRGGRRRQRAATTRSALKELDRAT